MATVGGGRGEGEGGGGGDYGIFKVARDATLAFTMVTRTKDFFYVIAVGLAYTVKKVSDFHVLSRDVTYTKHTLAGNNLSRLGTGKTFFYSVPIVFGIGFLAKAGQNRQVFDRFGKELIHRHFQSSVVDKLCQLTVVEFKFETE